MDPEILFLSSIKTVIGMTRYLALSVAGMLVAASGAWAQAFGLAPGVPLSALEVTEELGGNLYTIDVPSPHREFEFYVAYVGSAAGLCMVRGVGIDHESDRYGDSLRSAFGKLESLLENKYGRFYKGDFLKDGSIWNEPHEWVMAVAQNERVYQAVWDREERSMLPDEVHDIILSTSALDSDTSYLVLQYRFSNKDQCDAELEELDAEAL